MKVIFLYLIAVIYFLSAKAQADVEYFANCDQKIIPEARTPEVFNYSHSQANFAAVKIFAENAMKENVGRLYSGKWLGSVFRMNAERTGLHYVQSEHFFKELNKQLILGRFTEIYEYNLYDYQRSKNRGGWFTRIFETDSAQFKKVNVVMGYLAEKNGELVIITTDGNLERIDWQHISNPSVDYMDAKIFSFAQNQAIKIEKSVPLKSFVEFQAIEKVYARDYFFFDLNNGVERIYAKVSDWKNNQVTLVGSNGVKRYFNLSNVKLNIEVLSEEWEAFQRL